MKKHKKGPEITVYLKDHKNDPKVTVLYKGVIHVAYDSRKRYNNEIKVVTLRCNGNNVPDCHISFTNEKAEGAKICEVCLKREKAIISASLKAKGLDSCGHTVSAANLPHDMTLPDTLKEAYVKLKKDISKITELAQKEFSKLDNAVDDIGQIIDSIEAIEGNTSFATTEAREFIRNIVETANKHYEELINSRDKVERLLDDIDSLEELGE